jgi:hypothetical protein
MRGERDPVPPRLGESAEHRAEGGCEGYRVAAAIKARRMLHRVPVSAHPALHRTSSRMASNSFASSCSVWARCCCQRSLLQISNLWMRPTTTTSR